MDYQRIALLCERLGSLPALSGTALELIRVIDGGEDSILNLENLITRDAGLTAEVLRAASDVLVKDGNHVTVRSAIASLGSRAVRSIGLSLALRRAVSPRADMAAFGIRVSTCGFFVGQAARYMFARLPAEVQRSTGLSPDEVNAMGLLSNLGLSLLAKLSPPTLGQTMHYARAGKLNLHTAFYRLHGRHVDHLGALAAQTWGLPEAFVSGQRFTPVPMDGGHEAPAWSCIALARHVADLHGIGLCDWTLENASSPELAPGIEIDAEEIERLVSILKEHIAVPVGGQKGATAPEIALVVPEDFPKRRLQPRMSDHPVLDRGAEDAPPKQFATCPLAVRQGLEEAVSHSETVDPQRETVSGKLLVSPGGDLSRDQQENEEWIDERLAALRSIVESGKCPDEPQPEVESRVVDREEAPASSPAQRESIWHRSDFSRTWAVQHRGKSGVEMAPAQAVANDESPCRPANGAAPELEGQVDAPLDSVSASSESDVGCEEESQDRFSPHSASGNSLKTSPLTKVASRLLEWCNRPLRNPF